MARWQASYASRVIFCCDGHSVAILLLKPAPRTSRHSPSYPKHATDQRDTLLNPSLSSASTNRSVTYSKLCELFSVRLSCLHELSLLEEVVSLTRQNDVALLWSLWIHTMLISVTFTRLLIARLSVHRSFSPLQMQEPGYNSPFPTPLARHLDLHHEALSRRLLDRYMSNTSD